MDGFQREREGTFLLLCSVLCLRGNKEPVTSLVGGVDLGEWGLRTRWTKVSCNSQPSSER